MITISINGKKISSMKYEEFSCIIKTSPFLFKKGDTLKVNCDLGLYLTKPHKKLELNFEREVQYDRLKIDETIQIKKDKTINRFKIYWKDGKAKITLL
jgi:tmRNA-binding protein